MGLAFPALPRRWPRFAIDESFHFEAPAESLERQLGNQNALSASPTHLEQGAQFLYQNR
jgi:hypothetical protein